MRLYLVQHGEALSKDVDPERALSDVGRADAEHLVSVTVIVMVAIDAVSPRSLPAI